MKISQKKLRKIIKEEYKRILMEQMVREEPGALGAMSEDQLLAMLQATECPVAREEIELELDGRAMGYEEPEWQNPRWERTGANWER
mgnify:CR=1 FL=1|tara:strand:- start:621 stop:881 length:261 start_codon:yes stop_codon:yes gene_type:complete